MLVPNVNLGLYPVLLLFIIAQWPFLGICAIGEINGYGHTPGKDH